MPAEHGTAMSVSLKSLGIDRLSVEERLALVEDLWDSISFFFNDTAPTEIYTLSLHDALPISRLGWRDANLLDDVHAVDDLAEHGVLAGQPFRRSEGDEELPAVGVRSTVRHREDAGLVELSAGAEFIGEAVARAARAVAERVAALDHEVLDHAMEHEAVVVRLLHFRLRLRVGPLFRAFGEADEVRHRLRRILLEELHGEVPRAGREMRQHLAGRLLGRLARGDRGRNRQSHGKSTRSHQHTLHVLSPRLEPPTPTYASLQPPASSLYR